MIYYAFYLTSGQYVQTGVTMEPLVEGDIPAGLDVYYGQVNSATQYHDIASNQPVDMPPRPGMTYRFDFDSRAWVVDLSQIKNDILGRRDRLLSESDWTDTVSAQARLGDQYSVWQAYRQALRDITSQPGYPINIEWPQRPE